MGPHRDVALGDRHRRHRVHCVDDQVQDDLLELDPVSLDWQRRGVERVADTHLPAGSRRRKKLDGLADDLVEIELPQFEGRLLQEASKAPDDLAGALLVAADIGRDFRDLVHVGACGT